MIGSVILAGMVFRRDFEWHSAARVERTLLSAAFDFDLLHYHSHVRQRGRAALQRRDYLFVSALSNLAILSL
jgi:hypothetical protein